MNSPEELLEHLLDESETSIELLREISMKLIEKALLDEAAEHADEAPEGPSLSLVGTSVPS